LATFLGEDFAGLPPGDTMQISALNTIIAAQQARSTPTPPRPAPNAPAAQKAAAPEASPPQDFAPLAFGQAAAPGPAANASAPPPYPAGARLGSQVDIRV
jgi:hypothetical protein